MSIDFTYDEAAAFDADKAALQLTDAGAYVGTFTKAFEKIAESGTEGIELQFTVPGAGVTSFTFWTAKDGKAIFGAGFINAILFLMGLPGAKAVRGEIEVFDRDAKARVKQEGNTYPSLCSKPIGVVLQKELYTTMDGVDGERLSPVLVFQPETNLTFTELKKGVVKAQMQPKLLAGLKVKDKRKKQVDTAQPDLGGISGEF